MVSCISVMLCIDYDDKNEIKRKQWHSSYFSVIGKHTYQSLNLSSGVFIPFLGRLGEC